MGVGQGWRNKRDCWEKLPSKIRAIKLNRVPDMPAVFSQKCSGMEGKQSSKNYIPLIKVTFALYLLNLNKTDKHVGRQAGRQTERQISKPDKLKEKRIKLEY